ncbi:3-phytase B precursor [Didymella exigua CBS 183.55]|uniref:Phytase A n=1 Tax=Didymella exigua CBS 183.55 TaxID=1150837 RepID=A0A6A5RJ22_9PLEO|nr:3-phytase B precursor [Didymella exigua CBS 183.55]KAF1927108.1 3-phytase B precursor [Didymella exigua CBS 183.55]
MMARAWNRVRGCRSHEYTPLPLSEKASHPEVKQRCQARSRSRSRFTVLCIAGCLFALYGLVRSLAAPTNAACDTVNDGYRCSPSTSHFWGQYAPWFAVPSDMHVEPPSGCDVTFANVLSRHGGRDPTAGKSLAYALLVADIRNTSTAFPGEFAFLKHYEYSLGADELTPAGRQEMVNSGAHFSRRYHQLVRKHAPFVRAGGQHRVVESAEQWLLGVAQSLDEKAKKVDVIIPEGTEWNNTLSHDVCPAFTGRRGYEAQRTFASNFVPPIQERVNAKLGTNLSATYVVYLMDMCPFDTLAHPTAKVSPFCHLFTEKEWRQYDYFQSLGKYYGYGVGNPLGATQGVGYVNELLARLQDKPVEDNTSTNRTLDSDPATFPLHRRVYADFSHDNDISGVLAALGLYNQTKPLSNTTVESTKDTHGYSAAWTVPFASRLYIEKLQCSGAAEEFVRIIVNDRVQPLDFCGADKHGRCTLTKFVESQSFSRTGGLWSQCYE